MRKILRLIISIPLAGVCYWLTLVGFGALLDMVENLPSIRIVIGYIWVASQPFAFGIFVFIFEALICYWLLELALPRSRSASQKY